MIIRFKGKLLSSEISVCPKYATQAGTEAVLSIITEAEIKEIINKKLSFVLHFHSLCPHKIYVPKVRRSYFLHIEALK